jgi:hypothetical protein
MLFEKFEGNPIYGDADKCIGVATCKDKKLENLF